jgi:hypothetical protein
MAELVCRADDPRWLAERRRGVTATDITAIAGLSAYDSLYSCYWRKLGGYDDPGDSDRLALGRHMEPYVEGRYCQANEVMPPSETGEFIPGPFVKMQAGALWRSSARPWQLATPDRVIGSSHATRDPFEPVEFKSWGTKDGWGEDGSDVMPAVVRAQLLWQMDVLGAAAGRAGVVFLPSGEFRSYRIGHHASHPAHNAAMSYGEDIVCEVCRDITALREAGADFWRRVTELDAPTPDGSAATLAALKARFAPDKGTTAEIPADLAQQWHEWRAAESFAGKGRKRVEAEMRELAYGATIYEADGVPFARREVFTAHVKAHDRATDRLMPVKRKEEKDE